MEKENEKATAKGNVYNGEDDDQIQIREESPKEEEKMEKFFALVRNLEEAKRNNKIRKLDHRQKSTTSAGWLPKFEWQDFTQDIKFIKPPPVLPSPCDNNHKRQEDKRRRHSQEDDDGTNLDLELTL